MNHEIDQVNWKSLELNINIIKELTTEHISRRFHKQQFNGSKYMKRNKAKKKVVTSIHTHTYTERKNGDRLQRKAM